MAKVKNIAGTAQDPTVKFAKLEIDGKVYKLCYSFAAIARAEEYTGVNLLQGLFNIQNLNASQLLALLAAALSVAQPDMMIDDVSKLIRLDTMHDVVRALGEAYNLSMPEPQEKKLDAQPEPVKE